MRGGIFSFPHLAGIEKSPTDAGGWKPSPILRGFNSFH
jgi:hypothetical protein